VSPTLPHPIGHQPRASCLPWAVHHTNSGATPSQSCLPQVDFRLCIIYIYICIINHGLHSSITISYSLTIDNDGGDSSRTCSTYLSGTPFSTSQIACRYHSSLPLNRPANSRRVATPICHVSWFTSFAGNVPVAILIIPYQTRVSATHIASMEVEETR